MFSTKSKLKEISFYFSTQIILIGTPLIYIPLVSSFLSPEEFGKTSLFLMFLSFSSQLFYGPISNGVNRFYNQACVSGKLDSFYGSIEKILVVIAAVIILIIILLYEFSNFLEDFSFLELLLIYLVILFFGVYIIFSGVLGVQRERPKQTILEICINSSKILSLYLLFKFVVVLNVSVIVSSLFSLFIAVILLYFLLDYKLIKLKNRFIFTSFFYSKIIKFAIPFTLWGPFLTGYFLSDRFLIKHFMTLKDLGNYSIQYQLTFSSMQLLTSLISGFMLPILLQENDLKKSFKKTYNNLMYLSFLFIILGIIGGFFLHEYGRELLHLFLKKDYDISPVYLLIFTLSGGIYGASQILAIKQTLQNKNTKLLFCNIILSLIGICLNYFAIQFYGMDGLVYSLLLLCCLWYLGILLLFKLK